MKQLIILVPNGENNLSSITGTFEIFSRANEYWKQRGNKAVFEIRLAGADDQVSFSNGLFTVTPHTSFDFVNKPDLIIIPSLNHNYERAIEENEKLVEWLRIQYATGAEIASICTGTFLLAAAGLLNGKTCSTHWSVADRFRNLFPEINLQPDRLITDENGIYTNGGAYSFLNLIIYLIEKFYDRQAAVYCSKVFQIEIDRHTQSEFTIFLGQKTHDDDVIRKAQAYIEDHHENRISMQDLSTMFNVSRRNFDRRFIRATGNTPIEYAQRVKIETAKKAFETSRKSVSDVMYDTGYSDIKAFREVFKKYTGLSPLEYKSRYNKDGVTNNR